MRVLVDYLKADMADTIAVGDAKIDIPMFACCAQSECMGSGQARRPRRPPDWVTTDVDDGRNVERFRAPRVLSRTTGKVRVLGGGLGGAPARASRRVAAT